MKRTEPEIFLELGGQNLEQVLGVAMEFRSVATSVWLLPSLCLQQGAEIMKSLEPLGFQRVVLDYGLNGDAYTLRQAILAISQYGGWGITVDISNPRAASVAREAMDFAKKTLATTTPVLIGTLPTPATDREWVESRHTFQTYPSFVRSVVNSARDADFYGVRVREEESGLVESSGIRSFVRARALPHRYSVSRKGGKVLSTPSSLLRKGVAHPVADPVRLGCKDYDMVSSLLQNEVRVWQEDVKKSTAKISEYSWGRSAILPEEPVEVYG